MFKKSTYSGAIMWPPQDTANKYFVPRAGLFVTQRLDGVELRGLYRGPHAEEQADRQRDADAGNEGPQRHRGLHGRGIAHDRDDTLHEKNSGHATCTGQGHRFGEELPGDVAAARTDGFADANFAGLRTRAYAAAERIGGGEEAAGESGADEADRLAMQLIAFRKEATCRDIHAAHIDVVGGDAAETRILEQCIAGAYVDGCALNRRGVL